MRRRGFVTASVTALLGAIMPASVTKGSHAAPQEEAPPLSPEESDYFLDSGSLSEVDRELIVDFDEYDDAIYRGEEAFRPRAQRPKKAPVFKFLHWKDGTRSAEGRFVAASRVEPDSALSPPYRLNAQIVGFHVATTDWRPRRDHGILTIEIQASVEREPMTWFFAQPFDVGDSGWTNLGMGFIAQRKGLPDSVQTDEPQIAMRVQMIRNRQQGGILREFLGTAARIIGIPLRTDPGGYQSELAAALPPVHVPRLVQEGVALSQALWKSGGAELPIWRGPFNPYSLTSKQGWLKLVPGLWIVVDNVDLRGVHLDDLGSGVVLARDGRPLDANYLVLNFEIEAGTPEYQTEETPALTPKGPRKKPR